MKHTQKKHGLAALLLSICIPLWSLPMKSPRALELDMTEALVDLLGRTSFDAAGSQRNYNHLLLWDYGSDVNLFVDQDVDGIDHDWVARNITGIMAALGPSASIRLRIIENPLDAHIIIVSAKNKNRLENEYFYDFVKRRFGWDRSDFGYFLHRINQLHSNSSHYWAWLQIVNDRETEKKRIAGFLSVIKPTEKSLRLSLSKAIFHALGYGDGSYMFSNIRSVQTQTIYKTDGIEGVDLIAVHFLYNSQARNGMEKASALRLFRSWLKSDEFRKLNVDFVKFQ